MRSYRQSAGDTTTFHTRVLGNLFKPLYRINIFELTLLKKFSHTVNISKLALKQILTFIQTYV